MFKEKQGLKRFKVMNLSVDVYTDAEGVTTLPTFVCRET